MNGATAGGLILASVGGVLWCALTHISPLRALSRGIDNVRAAGMVVGPVARAAVWTARWEWWQALERVRRER